MTFCAGLTQVILFVTTTVQNTWLIASVTDCSFELTCTKPASARLHVEVGRIDGWRETQPAARCTGGIRAVSVIEFTEQVEGQKEVVMSNSQHRRRDSRREIDDFNLRARPPDRHGPVNQPRTGLPTEIDPADSPVGCDLFVHLGALQH